MYTQKFLVSIILPTYNRAEYIKKAVESVLNQTYKNIELIIIDDCSFDKTMEIISGVSKKDSRIRIIRNKTNLKLVKTLNKGIRNARGKYIARIDDDDFWCDSQKLEKQVMFLENNPDYVLVGGGIIKVDGRGREIIRFIPPESDKNIRQRILLGNCFTHSVVLFKKEAWEKAGGYEEALTYLHDWDLWMRFGKLGKFYNFQEYFIHYLDQEYNNPKYAIRNQRARRQVKSNIKLRKKYRDFYPNYRKSFFLCWISYFYSFLPFRHKIRKLILNSINYVRHYWNL